MKTTLKLLLVTCFVGLIASGCSNMASTDKPGCCASKPSCNCGDKAKCDGAKGGSCSGKGASCGK